MFRTWSRPHAASPGRFATTCQSVVAVALLFTCVAPAAGQEINPRGREVEATQIAGVVQVRGCQPDFKEIDLRAHGLRIGGPGLRDVTDDPRISAPRAQLRRTPDPRIFEFVIGGLQPLTPYLLTLFAPPSPMCGTVFWRGHSDGLVVSGGPKTLIEGVAVTTHMELFDGVSDTWVGLDHVDFTNPAAAVRSLRWRSDLPGIERGELQISTSKFPTEGAFGACDEPNGGIIHRQQLPAVQGGWSQIDNVNFNAIVAPPGTVPGPISRSAYSLLQAGAPLYMRVVPLSASGPVCDATTSGVPGWVMIAKVPQAPEIATPPPAPPDLEAGQRQIYRPPYSYRTDDGVIHPTYDELAYRAVKAHTLPTKSACDFSLNWKLYNDGADVAQLPAFSDYIACQLVRTGELPEGVAIEVGQWFYYKMNFSGGGGSSFVESFASLVEAGEGAAAVGVNFFAEAYNGAVAGVKTLAYDSILTIPGVGQACDAFPERCKQAIDIGMTYAMTAAGLPPSAPNWDDLKDQGRDYFAQIIAEKMEEEGVPSTLTESVLREMTNEILSQMTENRGSSTNLALSWIQRWYGFAPASWSIALQKNSPDPLPAGMFFTTPRLPLFDGVAAPIPKTFPAPLPGLSFSILRVPVVLPPNLTEIPPPFCLHTTRTVPFRTCVPLAPFIAGPICRYEQWVGQWVTYTDEGCQKLGDMVKVYYRDAWLKKVGSSSCAALAGVTLQRIGPLNLILPGYSFFMGAALPPLGMWIWNGPVFSGCG